MPVPAPLVGATLVSQFLGPKDSVASKVKLKKRPLKNGKRNPSRVCALR